MSGLPICCVTGRIAGDPEACGDCDPCLASYLVPEPVKRLIAERDEWRQKYEDAMTAQYVVRCDMCGEPREGRDHSGCDRAYVEIVGAGCYP